MTATLELESERVLPTGNLISDGVSNLLGRPRIDPMTLLVREAGQNTWDARIPGDEAVRFGLHLHRLDAAEAAVMRDVVFRERVNIAPLCQVLDRSDEESVDLLVLADRGTTGLGGPTRADIFGDPSEPRDFVDFLRNIGQPPGRVAGGTYGYGKAAFYRASRAGAIVVHTHCLVGGSPESRFIAAAMGPSIVVDGVGYTGRHWWGVERSGTVEPVTGSAADELASSIGLPHFEPGDTGTTIAILAPWMDEFGRAGVADRLARAVLWHFWPKMTQVGQRPPAMAFSMHIDRRQVPLPDPATTPPLAGLVAARRLLAEPDRPDATVLEGKVVAIEIRNPVQRLGSLAMVKIGHATRDPWMADDAEAPIQTYAHHVALMRGPELVVRYVSGQPLPSSAVEYAGVFMVDPAVEAVFARSEPPAHDDWSPDNLEGRTERSYIRVAYRRIDEAIGEFIGRPAVDTSTPQNVTSLAAFSDELGGLLLGLDGGGLSDVPGPPRDKASPRQQRPRRESASRPDLVVVRTELGLWEGRPALRVQFALRHAAGSARTEVHAVPNVILEGHTIESEPPTGSDRPEILGWRDPAGSQLVGDRVTVTGVPDGNWSVFVRVPSDASVGVDLTAVDAGGAS